MIRARFHIRKDDCDNDYRPVKWPIKYPYWCSAESIDILPSLKQTGFLDTNVWNPGISTAGITHTFQFGNALPKIIKKYIYE